MVAYFLMMKTLVGAAATTAAPTQQDTTVSVPVWIKTTTGCDAKAHAPIIGSTQFLNSLVFEFSDKQTITWSGACINKHVSGIGTLVEHHPDGNTSYEVTMQDGVMTGHGTLTFTDGSSVVGTWKDGVLEGSVIINSSRGLHYEGEARNGLPDGDGIATWPNGKRYEGHWQDGEESGHGVMIYNYNGHPTYNGDFRNENAMVEVQ